MRTNTNTPPIGPVSTTSAVYAHVHPISSRMSTTIDTNALPTIIRRVRAEGYRFVTLRDVTGPR